MLTLHSPNAAIEVLGEPHALTKLNLTHSNPPAQRQEEAERTKAQPKFFHTAQIGPALHTPQGPRGPSPSKGLESRSQPRRG